jgi:putative selenium metabolism hydrolase
MLTREQKDEVIELCRRLIQIKSYSGGEGELAGALAAYFAAHGFEVLTDAYGNVIGHLKGKRPGKRLLFDGHIDTVPVGDASAWTYDPFGGVLAHDRIYGRGASDMKGAVAAMICGSVNFAQARHGDFAGDIFISCVVHEECFEGVAAQSVAELVGPDVVVIGEASELHVKIGQRGRAEIVLEVFGKPAHSANPEKGVNAVYKACGVIERIRRLVPPEHPVLGRGILELTDIKSAPYPGASVVPAYCRATYDRRLLVGETPESVLAPLKALLSDMTAEDDTLKAAVGYAVGEETCYTGNTIRGERFFPGWLFEAGAPFITGVVNELRAMHFDPAITQYNFCTNGSYYAGRAGIPTLGLGPSAENLAHTVDEYIEIQQLTGAAECYFAVMKSLLTEN